jgi:hypothetical protein
LFSIAAGILVAVGISFGVLSSRRPGVAQVSAEPLVAMHAINVQTEQDQQAALRALAMELRMMKLEMRELHLDPTSRDQLVGRIDSLLGKTRQLDTSSQILIPGD